MVELVLCHPFLVWLSECSLDGVFVVVVRGEDRFGEAALATILVFQEVPKGWFEPIVGCSGEEPSRDSNLLLSSVYFREVLEVVFYLRQVGAELCLVSVVLFRR